MTQTRIGISGWLYREWRGVFYPRGLPHKRELAYAAAHLDSIEINGTFYSMKPVRAFQSWYADTPPGFVFAVKGSRYITHMRKLRDIEAPLANFFAQGVLALEEKLGPLLWQFPPTLRFDPERFAPFFRLLPRTLTAAAALAEQHDQRLAGRAFTAPRHRGPLRHCIEVRSRSFVTPELAPFLREHDIGLVVADAAGKFPLLEELTSDFVYARLHGAEELYASDYSERELRVWARKIERWRRRRDVYVYFDNDRKVYAPANAMRLAELLRTKAEAASAPPSP